MRSTNHGTISKHLSVGVTYNSLMDELRLAEKASNVHMDLLDAYKLLL